MSGEAEQPNRLFDPLQVDRPDRLEVRMTPSRVTRGLCEEHLVGAGEVGDT